MVPAFLLQLRNDPGRPSLASVQAELAKLELVRRIELPADLPADCLPICLTRCCPTNWNDIDGASRSRLPMSCADTRKRRGLPGSRLSCIAAVAS